jgi:hypothetical protein
VRGRPAEPDAADPAPLAQDGEEGDPHSVVRIDDEAVGESDLPLLAAEPALRFVEEALGLTVLARGARDRESRPLPHVVMVDLGDGRAHPALQLRLGRPKMVALFLQGVRTRKVQLASEDPDEAAGHPRIQSEAGRR